MSGFFVRVDFRDSLNARIIWLQCGMRFERLQTFHWIDSFVPIERNIQYVL